METDHQYTFNLKSEIMEDMMVTETNGYVRLENKLIQDIKSCRGGAHYCMEAIADPTVEEWERKEYKMVLDGTFEKAKMAIDQLRLLRSL